MTNHELIQTADRLARDGLFAAAGDLLAEAIGSGSDDVILLRALGRVRMLQRRPAEAVDLLQRALRSIRHEAEVQAGLARQTGTAKSTSLPEFSTRAGPASDWDYAARMEEEILAEPRYEAPSEPQPSISVVKRPAGIEQFDQDLAGDASDGAIVPAVEDLLDVPPSSAEATDTATASEEENLFSDIDAGVLPAQVQPEHYEPEAEDFGDPLLDELPTRTELRHIPSRITRELRAQQVAVDVAEKFGWDRKGVDLLTALFVKHWWSSSRMALERALEAGSTRMDIAKADEVREVWSSHPEFASFVSFFGEVSQRYSVLPWPTAVQFVRSFGGYPDEAEIERVLLESYEFWSGSPDLVARFDSFYKFQRYLLDQASEESGIAPWLGFPHEEGAFGLSKHHALLSELESWGVYIKGEVFTRERKLPRKGQSSAEDFEDEIEESVEGNEDNAGATDELDSE